MLLRACELLVQPDERLHLLLVPGATSTRSGSVSCQSIRRATSSAAAPCRTSGGGAWRRSAGLAGARGSARRCQEHPPPVAPSEDAKRPQDETRDLDIRRD
jgi:hypothetical protein